MILVPAKTFREIINICRTTTANSVTDPIQAYIKLECDGKIVSAISFNSHSYTRLQTPVWGKSTFMSAYIKPVAVERESAMIRVTDPVSDGAGGAVVRIEQLNNYQNLIASVEIAQPAGTFVVPSEVEPKEQPLARIWINPKYLKDIMTGLTKSDRRKAVSLEICKNGTMLLIKTSQHDAKQILCGLKIKDGT